MKHFVTTLIFLWGTVGFLAAQGVTTAGIRGTVKANNSEPVPGATVVATHQPTGTRFGIVTNKTGGFALQNLTVGGPYRVEITAQSYQPYAQEGIFLSLGQTYNLKVFLVEGLTTLSEVTVSAPEKSRMSDASLTGAAVSVGKEQLERLPSLSRSLTDFTRLVPQSSGNSFAGRNNRYNNISVDGIQNNDIMGYGVGGGVVTGAPGGQAGTQPISLDAVEEIQVVIAPYDAKQGSFSGAGINAVTRSGNNEWSGSLYGFGRNERFFGRSPDAQRTRFNEFSDYQGGFRIGGPLIKNKLFFFINTELTTRDEPTLFVANRGTGASNESTIPVATAEEFATLLRTKYGYEPGAFENISRRTDSRKFFGRLDYNLNQSNRLTLRHNFVAARRDDLTNGVNFLRFENNKYIQTNNTNSTVLELKTTFSDKVANNLIVGYTRVRDNREIPGAPFPQVRVELGAAGSITAGTEGFSPSANIKQNQFQLIDNLSIYLGKHEVTLGTQNELFRFDNLFIQNVWGNYIFPNFNALRDNLAPSQYQLTFSNIENDPVPTSIFRAIQLGFYAQDAWQINEQLNLTGGLRLDVPVFPDAPLENAGFQRNFAAEGLRTGQQPRSQLLLSPRIGFNWDVTGKNKTVVRGGTGVFTGRLPFVWLGNAYNNTGVDLSRILATGAGAGSVRFQPDVNQQPRPGAISQAEINLTNPDFRMPQVWRSSLAIDQALPWGLVGTVEGIYSRDLHAPLIQDLNLVAPIGTLDGDGRERFPTRSVNGQPERRRFPEYTNVFYLTNTDQGYQYSFTAQLERRTGKGLYGLLAYTHSQGKDVTSMNATISSTNFRNNATINNPNNPPLTYSDWNLDHRIIAVTSYRINYAKHLATTISLFYNGQSGLPYSYRYNTDVNGDGNPANDMMYVPRDESDIILIPSNAADTRTPAQIWAQLNTFIEQDPYLRTRRGQFAERNGARTPWSHLLDLRVAQDFILPHKGKNHTLQVTFDVFNFTNMLSKDWGIVQLPAITTAQLPATLSGSILNFRGLENAASASSNGSGRARYSYNELKSSFVNDPFSSRWRAQLGLRYSF